MVNKKLKRRHHTVPESHLARFAQNKQLVRIELPGTKRHLISIGNAAVEKDFYLVERADGSLSDEFEDRFSTIEGPAAQAVREIVDDKVWPLPADAREAVATWTALQYLRTTTQRCVSNDIADTLFKASIAVGGKPAIRRMFEQAGRAVTDEEVEHTWARMNAFDDYQIKPGNALHLQTLIKLLVPTATQLRDRGWQLVRFARKALVTTDSPVVLIPDPGSGPLDGVGLATAGAILVPLDRRVALIMRRIGALDEFVCGTTKLANTYNKFLALAAQRAIFHHPDDRPLDNIQLPDPSERIPAINHPSHFLSTDTARSE